MAQFTVPAASKKYSVVVEAFRGVDLNNSPSNVDKSRSPEAPNMIRDQVGKVRKRTGYTTMVTAYGNAAINGIHRLAGEVLVHAGGKLYRRNIGTDGAWTLEAIGDMADARSRSFVFDEKLYLLDGSVYRVYDGTTLSAVAPDTFCRTDKEPLFLTDRGVFAITAEELTGEKYSQERSYYIGSAIREAEDRSAASACIYGDFYAMALDGTVYLLDLQQKTYEKNSPYSSFQYECYYFPDIPARVMFTDKDGALCFGTADGKLCRFASDPDSPASYNDDGEAITAYWDTADFDGNLFFQTKSFTGVAARLAAAPVTGVKIYALVRGIWKQVYDAKSKARYLSFDYIDFAKFTFSGDQTPRTLYGKVKLKKVDKVRFRLRNDEVNEPFGLYAFGVQYKEPGTNYRR